MQKVAKRELQRLQSPKLYKENIDRIKDSSTVIVGDFNNSLFIMIRVNRQKVNKEADE